MGGLGILCGGLENGLELHEISLTWVGSATLRSTALSTHSWLSLAGVAVTLTMPHKSFLATPLAQAIATQPATLYKKRID